MAEASLSGAQAAARIEGALDRAITHLKNQRNGGNLAAELIEARELLRHEVWITAPHASPAAITDRISATVDPFDPGLARHLLLGTNASPDGLIDDALTVAELVSALPTEPDTHGGTAVQRAGNLVHRLLTSAQGIRSHKSRPSQPVHTPQTQGEA